MTVYCNFVWKVGADTEPRPLLTQFAQEHFHAHEAVPIADHPLGCHPCRGRSSACAYRFNCPLRGIAVTASQSTSRSGEFGEPINGS